MTRKMILAVALLGAIGYSFNYAKTIRAPAPEVLVTAYSCDLLARIAVLAFEAKERNATREAVRRLASTQVTSVRVMERVSEMVDIGFEARSPHAAWDAAMASCRSTNA